MLARARSIRAVGSSIAHAREKIAAWTHDYNTGRPNSSLGYATPTAFVADLKSKGLLRSA